jgi:hypothetical protein
MKTNKNILLAAAMMMLPICSFSQTTAIGHMSVEIVAPASITGIQDMNLGNVNLSESANTTSVKSLKNKGSMEILNEGNVSLASFRVSGTGAAYSISLPEGPMVTNNSRSDMKVSGFRTVSSSKLRTGNSENIVISANVQFKPDEAHGLYKCDAPLRVTVNYN